MVSQRNQHVKTARKRRIASLVTLSAPILLLIGGTSVFAAKGFDTDGNEVTTSGSLTSQNYVIASKGKDSTTGSGTATSHAQVSIINTDNSNPDTTVTNPSTPSNNTPSTSTTTTTPTTGAVTIKQTSLPQTGEAASAGWIAIGSAVLIMSFSIGSKITKKYGF